MSTSVLYLDGKQERHKHGPILLPIFSFFSTAFEVEVASLDVDQGTTNNTQSWGDNKFAKHSLVNGTVDHTATYHIIVVLQKKTTCTIGMVSGMSCVHDH